MFSLGALGRLALKALCYGALRGVATQVLIEQAGYPNLSFWLSAGFRFTSFIVSEKTVKP